MNFSISFEGTSAQVQIRTCGLRLNISPVNPLAAPVHIMIDACAAGHNEEE